MPKLIRTKIGRDYILPDDYEGTPVEEVFGVEQVKKLGLTGAKIYDTPTGRVVALPDPDGASSGHSTGS